MRTCRFRAWKAATLVCTKARETWLKTLQSVTTFVRVVLAVTYSLSRPLSVFVARLSTVFFLLCWFSFMKWKLVCVKPSRSVKFNVLWMLGFVFGVVCVYAMCEIVLWRVGFLQFCCGPIFAIKVGVVTLPWRMRISLRMKSCWGFSGANQGMLFMEVLWHPFGAVYGMNLLEVFTECVDCTCTEVGNNKKSQIKNRREVKVQLRRGEKGERKIKFSFSENGEFFFTSGGEEWISPSAKQPIAPRHVPILGE